MRLEKIYDGRADNARSFELLNRPYPGQRAGQWFETDAEHFDYMLGVLPPAGWIGNSFAICEGSTGELHNSYHRIGERYFCLVIRGDGARAVRDGRAFLHAALVAERERARKAPEAGQ